MATYRSRVLSPVYNEIRRVYNRKTRREIYFVFSLRWTVWSIFSGTVAQEFFAPPFVFNITGISWYTNAGIHLSHQISQIWEAGITIATCQRPLDPLLLMNVCTYECMYVTQCTIVPANVLAPLCLRNESTLASYSFHKHGLILIILGKRHQRTIKNYMHIQLVLFFRFCLLYLLLNSCDGNDAKQRVFQFLGRLLVALKRAGRPTSEISQFYFTRYPKWCPFTFTHAQNCFSHWPAASLRTFCDMLPYFQWGGASSRWCGVISIAAI